VTVLAPAGGWEPTLLEVGTSIHPGAWVGPGFPEMMWSPMNALLLGRPGSKVLIDAGPGPLAPLWPFDGIHADLAGALATVGCRVEDVDLVVISHLDDDHVGGLVSGVWPALGGPSLPGARVVAPRAAVEAALAGAADEPRRRALDILLAAGALATFEPGEELAPGVRALDAPGHRVGHVAIEVVDGANPLLHLCDALHHLSHVEHPAWDRNADSEPEVALGTRVALLDRLAAEGLRAVASHIPGPHAFRVVREGDGALRAVPDTGGRS
jgi:glyoxylase-like metal-dependent hydrolase (beta-lactamase superfamily II)